MNKVKLYKFSLVGGVGFIIDVSIFTLLYQKCELQMVQARVVAFLVAATATWFGHRCFTFPSTGINNKLIQWKKFITIACFSALPNFLVFKLVVSVIDMGFLSVYIAMAMGVLAGMISNFLLSDRWVFTGQVKMNISIK